MAGSENANLAADIQERLQTLRQKLAKSPLDPVLHNQLGLTVAASGKIELALEAFDRALSLCPSYGEAFMNRGLALEVLNRAEEAFAAFTTAYQLTPLYDEAEKKARETGRRLQRQSPLSPWPARPSRVGRLFQRIGFRHTHAGAPDEKPRVESDWRAALEANRLNPHDAAGFGVHLSKRDRLVEAECFLRFALLHGPSQSRAAIVLAELLERLKRPDEAVGVLSQTIKAGGQAPALYPLLLRLKQSICDWDDYDSVAAKARAALRAKPDCVVPFAAVSISDHPDDHLKCAQAYANSISSRTTPLPAQAGNKTQARDKNSGRLTVGYISADFHQHPVATLVAGLFEQHDRRKFKVHGYSLWMDDGSAIRQRIRGGCDRFVELWGKSSQEAAETIAADGVDILVDLTGYTGNGKPEILALRPAPVQVNYLGYPGTMGASFVDYVMVDEVIAPPGDETWYAEKLVRLPVYQVNDNKRATPAARARGFYGLPERGVVFCNFNGNKKYTPEVFDVWMNILRAVPESVLWLAAGSPASVVNLRREASLRGVAAERLIFSEWTASYDEHLARYGVADLFLDTLPYTAHTTASDALWMACPVVTCLGKAFPGRVAASVLKCAGLSQLATLSLPDFQALAINLGNDPEQLKALRRQLRETRAIHPLFDTPRITRSLEAAFLRMWEKHSNGEPTGSIEVYEAEFR
jgi:protein O-GlcNAc transferase